MHVPSLRACGPPLAGACDSGRLRDGCGKGHEERFGEEHVSKKVVEVEGCRLTREWDRQELVGGSRCPFRWCVSVCSVPISSTWPPYVSLVYSAKVVSLVGGGGEELFFGSGPHASTGQCRILLNDISSCSLGGNEYHTNLTVVIRSIPGGLWRVGKCTVANAINSTSACNFAKLK